MRIDDVALLIGVPVKCDDLALFGVVESIKVTGGDNSPGITATASLRDAVVLGVPDVDPTLSGEPDALTAGTKRDDMRIG